ncbi:hypothetical protein ACLKA7_003465 [Drosophila subpalustris]
MLCFRIFITFVLLLGTIDALPRADSLRELRKLMRQRNDDEREQQVQHFRDDIGMWTHSLEQMGLNLVAFVDQCRPMGSQCSQRHVQRLLRSIRRSCSELRGQLETLEIRYLNKISEEEILMPTLRAVRGVLLKYDHMLKLINEQAYKLVDQ